MYKCSSKWSVKCISALQNHIDRSFITQLAEIGETLTAQTGAIVGALELFYELTIQPVLVGIASGVAELVTTTGYISYAFYRNYFFLNQIDVKLSKQFERIKDFLNEWKKDLIKEIPFEVSLQIVGESYYRWDSTFTYFPTVTASF